jgi:DNA invertase Pin-like site-specific DNA recombinase
MLGQSVADTTDHSRPGGSHPSGKHPEGQGQSSEEGLEQELNSLDAQREACEAFVASQKAEGWVLVRDRFDDRGLSGGTLKRPAVQQPVDDIENGLVDVVVVYKIDRLGRARADVAKLVEVFDRNGVTFVSVTQAFNTTTSMERLTLNILLSVAQFERGGTGYGRASQVQAAHSPTCTIRPRDRAMMLSLRKRNRPA